MSKKAFLALLVFAFAAAPAAGMPARIEHVSIPIARASGTCPATLPLSVTISQYEGGYTLDVTAQTMRAAYSSELVSATPQRIAFQAEVRPSYASCEGSGRSKDRRYRAAFHRGEFSYIVAPGNGPNGTPPSLRDVSVDGTPHVKMSFSD